MASGDAAEVLQLGAGALDQFAYAVSVACLVRQRDDERTEIIGQRVSDLTIVRLPCAQAEPDREALCVDDVS